MGGWDLIFCRDVREQGTGSFLLARQPFSAIAPFSRSRLIFFSGVYRAPQKIDRPLDNILI